MLRQFFFHCITSSGSKSQLLRPNKVLPKKTTDHDFELGCNRKQGHEGNQQVVLSVNICGYQL